MPDAALYIDFPARSKSKIVQSASAKVSSTHQFDRDMFAWLALFGLLFLA